MVAANKLPQTKAARILVVGYPGSGKTGALASLANAGYKLRVLDYDGNLEPLLQYTDPDKLANIDVVTLEDKLRSGQKFIEAAGIPTAFADGLKMMDRWKYKDPETDEEIDLGASKEWGPDTVVVVDSLTSMGQAAKRRAMAMLNKTPLNFTQQGWGLAMADQEAFIEKLTSAQNKFHVVVLAHLKLIGPKDIMPSDDDLTKDLKERVADIVPTRLYPSALGQSLPPVVGAHFPTVVLADKKVVGKTVRRFIRTVPTADLDLKAPVKGLPAELDLEDGLLKLVTALTKRSE